MGLFSSKRPPSALNPLRDQLVRDLRALARRCAQEHPAEHEYRGILTRVGSLMEGQGPRLDALSEWDLDQRRTDPAALHEGLQVLTGAQHLPRMVYAVGAVLEQEKRDRRLGPLQEQARELLIRLEDLTHAWLLRHEELLGGLEELE